MSIQEALQQLQNAPLAERIEVIEILLQSLKEEMIPHNPEKVVHSSFRVYTVDLGANVEISRDELYMDRMFRR